MTKTQAIEVAQAVRALHPALTANVLTSRVAGFAVEIGIGPEPVEFLKATRTIEAAPAWVVKPTS